MAKGDAAAFKAMVEADAWSVSPRGAMSVADFIKWTVSFHQETPALVK